VPSDTVTEVELGTRVFAQTGRMTEKGEGGEEGAVRRRW